MLKESLCFLMVLIALTGISQGTQPTLTTIPLSNAVVSTNANGAPLRVNLSRHFNTPPATNVVRVITSLTDSKTNPLGFTLQLFPTNAPKTVANFLAYVNDGAYENMLIHRSVPNFVIQTGGYTDGGNPNNWNTPIATWTNIVPCEYGISNLRGTVAMALVGTDSNSATDQWFVNLANNSSTLDATNTARIPLYGTNGTINFVPNPPFTVFAQVIGNGMQVVDAISLLPTKNLGVAFETLPLLSNAATIANLITIKRVATLPYFSLSSDPNSYATQVNGTNLTVTYVGSTNPPSNPVTISVFAYDTNGLTTNSSFQVWYQTNAVQTITFPSISNQPYSTAPVSLPTGPTWPTSSDGVPITSLNFSGPLGIATNGNAYFTGVGTIAFTAISAGNFFYRPATNMISFTVSPANQTITFPQIFPTNQIYSTNPFILTNAPYSSSGIPVNITIKQGSPMTVISNKFYMTGMGTVTLIASNSTNVSFYNPATPVTNTFTISPAPQTITFPPISNQVLPVTPFVVSAKASSGLPVTYTLISNSPASITNGNTLRINAPGVITIVAKQAGTNVYLPAAPVTNYFRAASNQTIGAFASIPNRTYTNPSASVTITPIPKSSSGLPVTLSVKLGPASLLSTNSNSATFSITGAGIVTLAANQSGNSNFFSAPEITTSFTVAKASQSFSKFTGIPPALTNGTTFTIPLPTLSSGLTNVTLIASGAGYATATNTIVLTNAGTLTITATNSGSNNYLATSISTNIPVAKANQSITFPGNNVVCEVGKNYALTASSSSGLTVTNSLTPANTPYASISGTILTIKSYTSNIIGIIASQNGNSGYLPAKNVTNYFTIIPNQGGGSTGGSISIGGGGNPSPVTTGMIFGN